MDYVVTEKGHNFYWKGKDLPAGTEFEARAWEVQCQEKLGLVVTKEKWENIQNNYIEFEKRQKENEEKLKIEQAKGFGWDLNRNKDIIQTNADIFLNCNPCYYDKNKIWWKWNKESFCWEIIDEIEIINIAKKVFDAQGLNKSDIRKMFLTAIQDEARFRQPKQPSKTIIQFKNKIYDLKTNEITDASPEYFICNPLPYDFGESTETPNMDKLFIDWVGEDNIKLLYEIIAYCCLQDYPLHHLFCFIGSGRNGKTTFQSLLTKFIGKHNCVSTELDALLESRFESSKLFKKLVCTLGETNFGVINKTSLLKKLTGQDLVGYEYKNKNPFDDYNYAKIIINSNSLPISEDTSDGFYRRWIIVDFPNEFEEGQNILDLVPEEEYNNLSLKIIKLLPELLMNGKFTNQGSIEERKKKYIIASNPLTVYLKNFTYEDAEGYVRDSEIYTSYCIFLQKIKKRVISRQEFGKIMSSEGYERVRSNHNINGVYVSGYYYNGIVIKTDIKTLDSVQIVQVVKDFLTHFTCINMSLKTLHNQHNFHEKEEEFINTMRNLGIEEELLKE